MSRALRIVADANVPMVEALFSDIGDVSRVAGRDLDAASVADADILIVRSVTRVDAALLAGSGVRFVGSATIGTDHLDLPWLEAAGIAWANAPGSNAGSVVEYVLAALAAVPGVLEPLLAGRGRVAVVGYGNVGGRLYARLQRLGIDTVACDPLIQPPPGVRLLPLDEALHSEVVCLHTPLTRQGAHATFHLLDEARLGRLPRNALLLNAGRGAVVDSSALAARLATGALRAVLDVWEEEPGLPPALLDACELATPHIAGYSVDGKLAGALMVHAACRRFLGLPEARPDLPLPAASGVVLDPALRGVALLRQALLAAYDIRVDHHALRRVRLAGDGAAGFDRLRRDYPPRRAFEWQPLRTAATGGVPAAAPAGWLPPRERAQLQAAGFTLPA